MSGRLIFDSLDRSLSFTGMYQGTPHRRGKCFSCGHPVHIVKENGVRRCIRCGVERISAFASLKEDLSVLRTEGGIRWGLRIACLIALGAVIWSRLSPEARAWIVNALNELGRLIYAT